MMMMIIMMIMMMMMIEIIAMITWKKKTLFTPSPPLYPNICFNFGFAGNDDVVADDDEEEDKDDVMKRILTCWRLLRHVSPVLSSLSVFKRLVAPDLKLDQKIFSFQAINFDSEICDLSYCCCILKRFILSSHGAQPFFCTNQRHLENVVKTSGEVGNLPRYQFEMVADL